MGGEIDRNFQSRCLFGFVSHIFPGAFLLVEKRGVVSGTVELNARPLLCLDGCVHYFPPPPPPPPRSNQPFDSHVELFFFWAKLFLNLHFWLGAPNCM